MNDTVWKYLRMTDRCELETIRARLSCIWRADDLAVADIVPAALQIRDALEDEFCRIGLLDEAKACLRAECIADGEPESDICDAELEALLDCWFGIIGPALLDVVLCDALTELADATQRWIENQLSNPHTDTVFKSRLALYVAGLSLPSWNQSLIALLLDELADQSNMQERYTLRAGCAVALGKLKQGGERAIALLSSIAQDRHEPQPLRAYCIEALMDMGTVAKASASILHRLMDDETEGEDIRNVAWAALKSVTADSDEHQCGGTVADHMRSLYRTEMGKP